MEQPTYNNADPHNFYKFNTYLLIIIKLLVDTGIKECYSLNQNDMLTNIWIPNDNHDHQDTKQNNNVTHTRIEQT